MASPHLNQCFVGLKWFTMLLFVYEIHRLMNEYDLDFNYIPRLGLFVNPIYQYNLAVDTLWPWKWFSLIEYGFCHECGFYEMLGSWCKLFRHLKVLNIYTMVLGYRHDVLDRFERWHELCPTYYSKGHQGSSYNDVVKDSIICFPLKKCGEIPWVGGNILGT